MATEQQLDFTAYTDALRALLLQSLTEQGQLISLALFQKELLWQESTLTHALYALSAHLQGIECPEVVLEQTEAGALYLFGRAGHLWEGFAYPILQAECGGYLALLAKWKGDHILLEKVKKIAQWHLKTLDHRGLPVFSFHCQEGGGFSDLVLSHAFLFTTLSEIAVEFADAAFRLRAALARIDPPSSILMELLERLISFSDARGETLLPSSIFCDKQLDLAFCRTATTTVLSTASGCKSSLGAFLHRDVAVLSYGPQTGSLGECAYFGIAGRARFSEISLNEKEASYRVAAKTHMTAPSEVASPFSPIEESGFSGLFCESEQTYKDHTLDVSARIYAVDALAKAHFVFFVQAKRCRVGKLHQLSPCSFDRYCGPQEKIYLAGEEGSICIDPKSLFKQMEVIPLAGGDCFWGSDFLIAFAIDKEALYCWSLGVEHEI